MTNTIGLKYNGRFIINLDNQTIIMFKTTAVLRVCCPRCKYKNLFYIY